MSQALDMAVEQEGAQHAETLNVTPGSSSSLPDHGCTCNVPVTTEEMCPEEVCPSEDFTANATAMPSEGSSINISSAAVGADKGDAHKGSMKIVVDITADCSSAARVPLTTGETCSVCSCHVSATSGHCNTASSIVRGGSASCYDKCLLLGAHLTGLLLLLGCLKKGQGGIVDAGG